MTGSSSVESLLDYESWVEEQVSLERSLGSTPQSRASQPFSDHPAHLEVSPVPSPNDKVVESITIWDADSFSDDVVQSTRIWDADSIAEDVIEATIIWDADSCSGHAVESTTIWDTDPLPDNPDPGCSPNATAKKRQGRWLPGSAFWRPRSRMWTKPSFKTGSCP